jgi:hypothetical protein
MEKLKCRFCSGDLVQINGVFHCWSCDKNYVMENGNLRALICNNCGENLSVKDDCYECELCGQRYKKEIPVRKTEEEPSEKIVTLEGDEKITMLWRLSFLAGYSVAFLTKTVDETEYAEKALKDAAFEALEYIDQLESPKTKRDALSKISAKFLGAVYYLYNVITNSLKIGKQTEGETDIDYIKRFTENAKMIEKRKAELGAATTLFARKILERTDDAFAKMVTERAIEIFTPGLKRENVVGISPDLAKFHEELRGRIGLDQRKLTAQYWEEHREEFRKLNSEKTALDNEIKGYNNRIRKAEKEGNKKAFETLKELDAVNLRTEEITSRLNKLNFFQRREKERLIKERNELVITKKNLENKAIYQKGIGKQKAEAIRKEIGNRWFEAGRKLTYIEKILEMNRYPGEELFTEIFEEDIRNTRKKLGYFVYEE